MLGHDGLAEEFGSVGSALRREYLIILVQLYLIVFDRLRQRGRIRNNITIFDIMKLLETIDSY